MTITGMGADSSSRSAVPPRTSRLNPDRPVAPATTASASTASMVSRIRSGGGPSSKVERFASVRPEIRSDFLGIDDRVVVGRPGLDDGDDMECRAGRRRQLDRVSEGGLGVRTPVGGHEHGVVHALG